MLVRVFAILLNALCLSGPSCVVYPKVKVNTAQNNVVRV